MQNSIPWTEKYRPNKIEDIVLDAQIEEQIKIFLLDLRDVHLVITGLPGIGKTTTVRCIAKKILGENLNQGYLELNAAEDRGVRSISTIVPPFCKKIVNFKCSKIILFDEADNITAKCQYDINELIKLYGRKTKFIFTCNDSTKIYEDIQSVCRIIRFKKLTNPQIKQYLEKICQIENVTYNKIGLDTICYISDGDMRKSINNLQLTAFSFERITKKDVLDVCKMPDPEEICTIVGLCKTGDLDAAVKEMNIVISQGYYYLDIITSFIYVLSESKDNYDLKLIDIINQTKITISLGLRSNLQLVAMICRLIKISNLKQTQ